MTTRSLFLFFVFSLLFLVANEAVVFVNAQAAGGAGGAACSTAAQWFVRSNFVRCARLRVDSRQKFTSSLSFPLSSLNVPAPVRTMVAA